MHTINTVARTECGFAAIEDIETGELRDHMVRRVDQWW